MSDSQSYGSGFLDSFDKKPVLKKKDKFFGLSFPLSISDNSFFSKSSGKKLITGCLKQLLETDKGERLMHPDYGLDIKKYLFQPVDEETFENIRQDVLFQIKKYIGGIKIKKLAIYQDVYTNGANAIKISLSVSLNSEPLTVFDVEATIS